ncbi:MAG: sulfite exporter TauE/SafE family protein [Flavobacteriaceae bacterium]|nr:sulfite exporter TauE/SafE family protein [Flavobacteriaceae bacterium]
MFYSALILGLLGSFHCIGMCGPIAFVLPLNRENNFKKAGQISLYHLGRLLSYSFIGLIFGLIGKGLFLMGFQQRISILVGVLMIVIVLIPARVFNRYNFSKPLYSFIGKVKSNLGKLLKNKSNKALFTIGILNGFLPCGLVYMALVGSIATGHSTLGALYMFIFGLGTVPLMTTAVYLGNILSISIRTKIQKVIPVFVILIGILFILRGMGLGIPYISPSDASLTISNNSVECVDINSSD